MRDYHRYTERRRERELQQRLDNDADLAQTLQRRRRLVATSGVLLVSAMLGIIGFFVNGGFVNPSGNDTPADQNYYAPQLAAISQTRDTLAHLDAVLSDQKRTLEDRERLLSTLKDEHDALNKVLSVDRVSVEAIFEQQQRRYGKDVWAERGVGFILGVLSGLLTALLLHWAKRWNTN